MPSKLVVTFTIIVAIAIPSFAISAEKHGSDCASCHTLSDKDATQVLSRIGGSVKSVKQAPAKGFFELMVEKDGKQGIITWILLKRTCCKG